MKLIRYQNFKRVFELSIALTALIILLPLFALVALAIKLESRGPAVYYSKRVGQNYRIFDLIKFRTMSQNADKKMAFMKSNNMYTESFSESDSDECPFCKLLNRPCSPILQKDSGEICENQYFLLKEKQPAFYKIKNDPRVTRIGKFLRMTSIDELPQLINIIKGDMSLIGNRPLPLYEAEKLTHDHAIERFNSPAGITGLWQVTKRGKSKMSAEERISLDVEYSKSVSFKTDLLILLKTFPALFQKESV